MSSFWILNFKNNLCVNLWWPRFNLQVKPVGIIIINHTQESFLADHGKQRTWVTSKSWTHFFFFTSCPIGVFCLSCFHFPHLRGMGKYLDFIWVYEYASAVVETVGLKLNHIGSLKSVGFSCWGTPISHRNSFSHWNVTSLILLYNHGLKLKYDQSRTQIWLFLQLGST